MKHQLFETIIHIATGGRPFINNGEALVFIHGSGQSHLTWILQSRYFAYRGYQVLAPDFPGHGLSEGTPLDSIEALADWVITLLDSLDVKTACLVGHSQGCLVTIDAAARYPNRITRLGLIAGALSIPVNDHLLSLSDKALSKAIQAMISWGHGSLGHMHDNTQPGHSFLGFGNRLMAANNQNALKNDLIACNNYKNGTKMASNIQQPALCILAEKDKMTPLKSGQKMANTLVQGQVTVIKSAGHMLPAEFPAEINTALRNFLNKTDKS
jgi:pimeloyl-ACP methyl ester carboxylesterase